LSRSATNIPSAWRIANIAPNDEMILPYDANPGPDGIFGKDRVLGRSPDPGLAFIKRALALATVAVV
jgi:hypothetical protein